VSRVYSRFIWVVAYLLLAGAVASAHESRPAYLEIKETAPGQFSVLWHTPVLAGMRLPIVLKLPDDVKNLREPNVQELSDSFVERRWIDAGPTGLAGKRIEFPGLQFTITDVLVRVELLDGRKWTTIIHPSQPWVEIAASQTWLGVAGTYIVQGIRHILFGADHMLFVLGLLLIVKDRWMLLKTVTAFTVAHSITLAIATLGYAEVPILPLNAAIALSILFLGPEIVRSWRGQTSFTIRHPWVVAFAFGLLHGFGFASALTSAGLPRHELPLALVSFNVGVELGQLGFIALILGLERSFRILEVRWPRWAQVLPGYTVGSLGAFWTVQRVALLFGGGAMNERRLGPLFRTMALIVFVFLCAQMAFAHPQKGEAVGFLTGFRHPISGLDHVLAMVAVGLWGAQLGAPAIWVLPVAFPMVMAFGGMLGLMGVPLPGTEYGIALSAILLGAAVLFECARLLGVAAALVGVFAIFHGHAHGTELPPGQSALLYSMGFVIATGCLHALGIGIGTVHRWSWGQKLLRVAGALVVIGGSFFMWKAVA
jgi:hydrogenase/urease accessory protein HupE